jgi:multisubunit Na+/H+ antiporter MnhF subunit
VIEASFVLLTAAAMCFLYRLLRGPTLVDRVIAVDGLLVAGASAIVVDAIRTGSGAFVPVVVVVTLVGFVGTAVVARFIEGRGA